MKIFFSLMIITSILLAKCNHIVVIKSKYSFGTTYKRAIHILRSKGYDIYHVIDFRKDARKIKQRVDPSRLILFGGPRTHTKLLRKDRNVGIDLPLKLYIYKRKGKTFVAYHDPLEFKERYYVDHALVGRIQKFMRYLAKRASGQR